MQEKQQLCYECLTWCFPKQGVGCEGFKPRKSSLRRPRRSPLPPARPTPAPRTIDGAALADARGQLLARRALEIASAGGHNLLLVGPPGAGKTMMARRLPGI